MIDPQLERAGLSLRDYSRVKEEILVDGYDKEPFNRVTDYTLYRENGEVLVVVEAKKAAVDVRLAEAQLTHYVTKLKSTKVSDRSGFYPTDWKSISWMWDMQRSPSIRRQICPN
jgi:type I site-specific restriction endonuclease